MESNSFHEKDETLWCEQCSKRNVRKKLNLYQINYEESIFLCPTKKCTYPLEEEDILKFIRKRKLSEIGPLTSKKLSKKPRLAGKNALPGKMKGHGNDHISSFSSSSNDFVEDLMDVSLEALDTPAESVNRNEKGPTVSFILNEITNTPTASSEDMFWNEVFSPKVPPNSNIVEIISSISSDGSIGKISDMEDMTTDFEKTYPLANSCQQSDSNVILQNNSDVLSSKDLLVPQNDLSDAAEITPLVPCIPEISQESHVETQENISPTSDEIVILKEASIDNEKVEMQQDFSLKNESLVLVEACVDNEKVETQQDISQENNETVVLKEARIDNEEVDPEINYPYSDSKRDQLSHLDLSHSLSLSEKPNSDLLAEDSILPFTTVVTEEREQVQQKSQLEKSDATNTAIILAKETISVSEENFLLTTLQPDCDKNPQCSAKKHLDLSKQSDNMSNNTEEETSKTSEIQGREVEQNSQIVSSLNENNRVYPLWRNRDALCWLDATLCLLVHNQTLKNYIEYLNDNGDCYVKKVIRTYEQAVSLANNEFPSTSENQSSRNLLMLMNDIREDTFDFLQKTMHCTKGKNDSPVFSFPLLLREKKEINELFLFDYRWELLCEQCGKKKIDRHKKTLPTFPSVAKDFNMLNASFLRPCFYCEAPDQRRYMRFDKLPNIFTIHFVQGLPTNNISQYDFTYNGDEYKITALVQYLVQPATHFVTWVRNVEGNLWLCCDDLQSPNTATYSDCLPELCSSEIHIVMWERQTVDYSLIESEEETVTQTEALIDELIDSLHNSPQSFISISSGDESDQHCWSTDILAKVKGKATIASSENNAESLFHEDVEIPSFEEFSSNSQKAYSENRSNVSSMKNAKSKTELSPEKNIEIPSFASEKDYIKSDNHTKLDTLGSLDPSVADSSTNFRVAKHDDSSNTTATSVKDLNKISELTSMATVAELTEKDEELLYLSEIGIEQTVEVATSSHSVIDQNEDSSVESLDVFKESGGNIRNYSKKNGFNFHEKKIDNSNHHNLELTESDKIGLNGTKLISDIKAEETISSETEDSAFQLGPCDPSLTTNADILESMYISPHSDDQTIHSLPYYIKDVKTEETHKSVNTCMVDSVSNLPPIAKDEKELIATETSVRNNEPLQTCKIEMPNNILQNKSILETGSSQTAETFIPNAILGDNTCVEICKSVPLDAPIEDGSVSYIVEVACPPAYGADATSQIIVLDGEGVGFVESDKLKVCTPDASHTKDESTKVLPPNTLHIVLKNEIPAGENGDALKASPSKFVTEQRKCSRHKKIVETENNNNNTKSIPDVEKFPRVISRSAAVLLEQISKVSDVPPKKQRTKASERKLKIKEKKVDLFKETKFALDFSENVLNSEKLLSSLKKRSHDHKTLNRGRSK